ncbi:MAG: glycoside hydrolase family 88 protein [Acidobacteriota bacterium]
MLLSRRQFVQTGAALAAGASRALAADTRVIGYAQDGKTAIEAAIPPNYKGIGGRLVIDGAPNATAVVIRAANPLQSPIQFPPTGAPYREHAEAWVLWRWAQFHAPDTITAPAAYDGLSGARIPDLRERVARTPRQVADQLAKVYGHDFNQLTYLPGMALIGQIRLGNSEEVAKLAAPYLDGRDLLARASSLTLAGHLVFAELARRTNDVRYTALVKKVADLGFTDSGEMKEAMPFHTEMSDSYFMAGPITALAGSLTGEPKYFDMVAKHFRFLDKLVLRPDGLFRHSPLTDAAWGRGNAFPALGMALALSEIPQAYADRPYILESFQRLIRNLARHQDPDGMWHEIIDEPGSYGETSATAMIATAILRGIRKGWLPAAEFQPRVDQAWRGVLARTGSDGVLLDVCESTNKQPTREAYLYRAALTGKDERGGGMVLFFATEMLGLN